MTQTTASNMFVPEVHEDMAQAAFVGAVKVAGSGAVLTSDTLVGVAGETVTFPKWNTLGDLSELTEGTAIVPAALGTSTATATIKEVGAGVEITDDARLRGLGNPDAEAARQFGVLQARKVDADLIVEAQRVGTGEDVPYTVDVAGAGVGVQGKFSWAAVVAAIAEFGDEWAPEDFAGIFINSEQHAEALADADFISADKLGQSGTPIAKGQVGAVGGVAVFVTDRVAAKTFLVLKNQSLGVIFKRRPIAEQDRDILKRTNVITTTAHYAVKRLNNKGVCVGTLTVGA